MKLKKMQKYYSVFFLVSFILASCVGHTTQQPLPDGVQETAIHIGNTDIAKTQLAIPSTTPTMTFIPTQSPERPKYSNYSVQNISISPNEEFFVLSTTRGMQVFNLSSGKLIYEYTYEPKSHFYSGAYTHIAWSPDEKYLAIGNLNEGVRIWDVSPWNLIAEKIEDGFVAYDRWINPGLNWSPDGSKLVMGFIPRVDPDKPEVRPGEVFVWDKYTNSWEKIYEGEFTNVTWRSNGKIIIMLPDGKFVDITSGQTTIEEFDQGFYRTVIWSPDERFYCSYHLDWSGVTDSSIKKVKNINCYPPVAWSANGINIAKGTYNGAIITNVIDNTEKKYVLDCDDISALAWTTQDELFAFGYKQGKNYLWNVHTGEIVLEID